MAQNITLLGASYSDCPAVLLPKTGGGTARFDDASVTTATASDVASGKIFLASDGTITTGTASGGGGASNVVTGTFKGTTTAAALDVTLNYSGSGFPIALVIYPSEGAYNPNGTFYETVKRYAYTTFFAVRNVPTLDGYTGSQNPCTIRYFYKSSSSTASSVTSSGSNSNTEVFYDKASTSSNPVRVRSKTALSLFIANTSYGFAANVEYRYWVLYSS